MNSSDSGGLTPPEERHLIDRALAGDQRAMRQLVERVSRIVLREAARSLFRLRTRGGAGYSIDVEDLRQEILALLFAKRAKMLDSFNPQKGSLAGYVVSIARSRIHNFLKRKAGAGTYEVSGQFDPQEAASRSSPQDRHLLMQLLDALQADLSEVLWRTFEEVFVHDRSAAEAAKTLGTNVAVIHLRVWKVRQRARALLRSSMRQHGVAIPARNDLSRGRRQMVQKSEDGRP